MTDCIVNSDLLRFSQFISSHMGLHFPEERWPDIQRGLRRAAPEFGFTDAEECIQWLMNSPLNKKQIEILASHLTIGETYFFREKPIFEALKARVLKELIQSRRETSRRLRIWCAACASGEEAYSIAILLSSLIPDMINWNITILATDINPHFLEKASQGLYKEWSFRNVPLDIKENNFSESKDNSYQIRADIKKMVRFSYLNLAEDTYPSLMNDTNAMDVILCKNVLMYFNQKSQMKVVQNLYNCLINKGWLIVSPCETSHILFSRFQTVNFSGTTFYKKVRRQPNPVPDTSAYSQSVSDSPPFVLESAARPESFPSADLMPVPVPEASSDSFAPQPESVPETGPAPFEEALSLYAQGRYPEVVDKLISSADSNSQISSLMARAYANQGKLADALNWSEKTVSADKLNPGAYYLQATILQEEGLIDEAMAALKKALYLDPDFVLAHFALGNLTRQQGKNRESERHFRNALLLTKKRDRAEVLPESEGVTAGRLSEIISRNI
ncbi:MAG: tetratricopeptide repeat protein [Candidatus Glassbacteria bacterium]|nr:tetratricopeptide repeat protein [Candidatus Glassbacteria bacterium]